MNADTATGDVKVTIWLRYGVFSVEASVRNRFGELDHAPGHDKRVRVMILGVAPPGFFF